MRPTRFFFFAMRLKREYLLGLNFPNMTEQDLYHIHHEQKEIIRNIKRSLSRDHCSTC